MRTRLSCEWPVLILLAGVLTAGPLLQGCDPLECGEGTREEDGQCVPVTPFRSDGGIHCGPSTVLVGNECVPGTDICGEFTEAQEVLDASGMPTGEIVCVGKPPTDERPPPECPEDFGPSGEFCVNGWVRPFIDDNGDVLSSVLGDPDGPPDATRLSVYVYDPLAYAASPDNPPAPLAVGEVNPQFGTFRVLNVPRPGTGFIALIVDEAESEPEDIYAFAGIPFAVGVNQHLEGYVAPAITHQEVDDWTAALGGDTALQALGCPEPTGGGLRTLATCGTWLGVFAYGTPQAPGGGIEGVRPQAGVIPLATDLSFYVGYTAADGVVFDDATAGSVWSDGDGPYDYTGRLGVVAYPTASLGTLYGICAGGVCESAGCEFPADQLGGAVPGAMFVQYVFPLTGTCTE